MVDGSMLAMYYVHCDTKKGEEEEKRAEHRESCTHK